LARLGNGCIDRALHEEPSLSSSSSESEEDEEDDESEPDDDDDDELCVARLRLAEAADVSELEDELDVERLLARAPRRCSKTPNPRS
jgi:hypothetical protein